MTKPGLSEKCVPMLQTNNEFSTQVTFGFTTIDRRETAFEAIRVIRRDFPKNAIIVVDQNEPTPSAEAFYAENNITVHFVAYDIGLSAARNLMFKNCVTNYFFILDDDIVEIPIQEIKRSFSTITNDDRILVIGGRSSKLINTSDGNKIRKINPPFNYFLSRRPDANFAFFFDPSLFSSIPTPRYDRDKNYRIADIVENFAIFDVLKYHELNLKWDDNLKIVAEHADFYLQVQTKKSGREDIMIVSNPKLIAYDIDAMTAPNMSDYRKKRQRHSFRSIYAEKWNIRAEMHVGKWLNLYREDGHETIKWEDLNGYSERQKAFYGKVGADNIQLYANYPIGNKRLTFIATTVDRFDAIQALALSIRSRYGNAVDIIFGIQSAALPEGFQSFIQTVSVQIVQLEYDIGLSAARNRIVAQVETEYFVLCDDDFILDAQFHPGNAIRVLDDEPDITGVGGYYRDVIYDPSMKLKQTIDRHFTFQASFEHNTGTLLRTPFYHLPAHLCYDESRGAMPADILQNITIFRRSDFDNGALYWDERMKITGEHLDFYVKNLLIDRKKYLFDPGFSVLHNRVQNLSYRKMRSRNEGIQLFYDKWNVKHEIDTELGYRAAGKKINPWRAVTSE